MNLLRIRDNSQTRKEEFSEIPKITNRIADKTLGQLAKEGVFVFPELIADARDISSDQFILQGSNEFYNSGNVMGFLGCGNERLVIESRFNGGNSDYFLQYLLDRVLDFPNILDMETDANRDNRLFMFLLFLFPYYLKSAIRKGILRTYVRNQYNNNNIKGTIEIARHIKTNTPFVGNVAYSQREYSYDNCLIELVRHTVEFIKGKSYGNQLLAKVKDEVSLIINATQNYKPFDRVKIITQNEHNPLRHAYFREYRSLQHLCILVLQHQKHQIGSGTRQIYGILFDGAWLWEEYVNVLVGDIFYHPMNKGGKGAQRLFGGSAGLIYPDFISRDNKRRIIADAKYKPINNIGNKDYLQLLAYMFRFDAREGFYFYPENSATGNSRLWMNEGTTYENDVSPRKDVYVTKWGLRIPSNHSSYDAFVEEMKASESEFVEVLISCTIH